MGGDDELRVVQDEVMYSCQNSELSLRRQGCFWFVKDVDALASEALRHERQE